MNNKETDQPDRAHAESHDERLYGEGAWNTVEAHTGLSSSNPGPQNEAVLRLSPNNDAPPATDHGSVGALQHFFELTHRRVQKGGWTHQVTERELPLSKEIAGVNMRIVGGAFREAHWHLADEWAYMLTGKARITLFGADGSMYIDDVQAGDLCNYPAGLHHSIQGLGDEGCEFLLVFNQASFSEESTFLISDWVKHTPPDIVQKNLGLTTEALAKLPKGDPLYIFQSKRPFNTLEQDRPEVALRAPFSKLQYTVKASSATPTYQNEHGTVTIVDLRNFAASAKIAAAIVRVKPGGLREMHWHPNVSEWQYWIQGRGRMTVFNTEENARTVDLNANDVGFVPAMAGRYIENTGDEDPLFLEMFAAPEFKEILLNNWLRSLPVQIAVAHTGFSAEDISHIPAKAEHLLGSEGGQGE